ncbi:MAG: AAA family ATPase [Acidimicrobiales bacterium]
MLVGIHPGWARAGWYQEAAQVIAGKVPDGYEVYEVRDDGPGNLRPLGKANPQYEFLVGRFYPGDSALDRMDLGEEVLGITADLQPLVDELLAAAKASSGSDEPLVATGDQSTTGSSELGALVEEFKRVRGYPIPKDDQSKAQRAQWAERLTADELQIADLAVIRQVINSGKYGGPGPQAVLNATLGALDAAGIEHFFETISELIWGEGDLAARIDRTLAPETGYKGLGEAVIMKLLAVTDPERILPVFPYNGDMGKAKLMQLVGLTPPPSTATRGQKQVASNDAIREVLEPYFPRDTWGQGQFLYWLRARPEPVGGGGGAADTDDVGALAAELYLPTDTLEDWLSLLHEKRQIIFYGPPGTGKTYVARKLAALIAGDPARQRLVQFHPSTSYEDFFEGYRPETTTEGNLGYRLVPGPLAQLAAQAEASPGVDHVMVIDEINRANLPKVFGELLFLLEYRDEQVQTLYRSEDAFELPNNLLFIGTMNTADKSIALIDAALRRRFHFVPFFPHEEPHNAVLASWLEDNNSDALWVAGLVEHVNERLIDLLGGPHLQIGPSHFFSKDLDEDKVRRIWRYSVLPFVEDQLWGQAELLRTFDFDQVLAAYRAAGGGTPDDAPAAVPAPPAPSAVSEDDPEWQSDDGEPSEP